MRPFLADVLDGMRKRPRVKVSKLATKLKRDEITRFILQKQRHGGKEKEYSEAAEKKFRRTWRHLQKILAEGKRGGSTLQPELATRIDRLLLNLWKKLGIDTSNKHANEVMFFALLDCITFNLEANKVYTFDDKSGIKYRLSDMALSPHTST
jgi:hypothetical protein